MTTVTRQVISLPTCRVIVRPRFDVAAVTSRVRDARRSVSRRDGSRHVTRYGRVASNEYLCLTASINRRVVEDQPTAPQSAHDPGESAHGDVRTSTHTHRVHARRRTHTHACVNAHTYAYYTHKHTRARTYVRTFSHIQTRARYYRVRASSLHLFTRKQRAPCHRERCTFRIEGGGRPL